MQPAAAAAVVAVEGRQAAEERGEGVAAVVTLEAVKGGDLSSGRSG